MPSAGDHDLVGRNLRVVRTFMDQLQEDLSTALGHIDPAMRDAVRDRWEHDHDVTLRRVNVLTGRGGRRGWFDDWDPAAGYHWPRLRSWLLSHRGRSEREIEALDDASDQILAHLEDPRPEGPAAFRVQGLVLGHVQSGKTANFTALIAKSADAGYKLVIVLSGIHNSLREQTQKRLALELGLEDAPDGVGLPDHGQRWITLTRSDPTGDFRPGTADANVLQGNERVILIVKKNASVLRRLIAWMGTAAQPGLPVLIIDDEADQASINTGGDRPGAEEGVGAEDTLDLEPGDIDDGHSIEEETSPSVINGLIRGLLASFQRVSYVAYTATPFANVLINPDALDREVGGGLYPADFIVSLPRRPGYIGAERLFGREALEHEDGPVEGLDVVRRVPDHEIPYLIPPRARHNWEPKVTPTLRTAIIDYVLATAAKLHRLGPGISTMLIHTTQLRAVQIDLGEQVSDEVRGLRNAWRYGQPSDRDELRDRWDNDHRPLIVSLNAAADMSFDDLEDIIDRLFRDGIDVVVLNSLTTDELDYEQRPERKVIVIGGNRLSRGITLEDLVVSFYVRNSPNYDTLLQMGRWFGYRESYVDLTRLWTTEELYANFRYLSLVEEDLRDQIAVYERAQLTPRELAPRILAHPVMQVTAANRMGGGREIRISYAGQLIQTTRFRLNDRNWLLANLDAARRFLSALGPPNPTDPERSDNRPHWRNVAWQDVVRLLGEFRSFQAASSFDADTVARYIRRQAEQHGELTRWWVSVRGLQKENPTNGSEDLHITGSGGVPCITRSRLEVDRFSVGVLTNPVRSQGRLRDGDEVTGLTDEEITDAREALRAGDHVRYGTALRHQRDERDGLLLLYPISRHSRAERGDRRDLFDDPDRGVTVIGMAIAFPPSDSAATRTYISAGDQNPDD